MASETIRIRAAPAVVEKGCILLVPHYRTDTADVQWVIPGGSVAFGESLSTAAAREFAEETGLQADVIGLLDVSEVILPGQSYHSITITFTGYLTGGDLAPEAGHRYGSKPPRWFSAIEIEQVACHPRQAVVKALAAGIPPTLAS